MARNKAHLCAGSGAIALLAVSAVATGARAQAASETAAGTVGEVVVTAQRRSEAAQDVPIALTVQTAEALQNAGAARYEDIAVLTPGLQFQAIGATQMPFLRGVGATTSAAGSEAGVALYVDDVYFPSSPASMMSLNNIDSVAVLRGPQGTLFGRNATGGVVQITTRRPGPTPRFDASLGYGNHDTKEGSLYASMPLSDSVAADIAISARNVDGGWGRNLFKDDPVFQTYDRAARTRWEFTVGPNTQLTLSGQYFRTKSEHGFSSTRLGPGELGQNERYTGGVIATEGFYDVDLDGFSGNSTKVYGVSARVVHSLGFADFKSVTAFTRMKYDGWVDFDFTRAFATYVNITPNENTYSQEFQLASPSESESPLKWVTGVYLYRDAAQYDNQRTFVPGVFTQFLNTKQNTKSWSVFGQVDYNITEATEVTLGIRYNRDRREFFGGTLTVRPVGAAVAAPSSGARTFDGTTYKIGLNHHFNDDLMAYIGYTTGFKSGFFSTQTIQVVPGQPTVALPVNPEKVKSVEGGFKSILADRKLRLNASAFYYDYSDLQMNAFLNNTTRVTLNVKKAEIYGLDVDAEWHVNDQLYFTLAAEWLHARYTDFANAPFFTPRTAAPWGLLPSIGNAKGNHITNAPDFTATLGANYTVPLESGELSFNGTAFYNGGFYFEPMNRLHQKSFVTINSTVKWTSAEGRYEIALWGRNLADEKVYASANPTIGGDAAEPREPRSFGVRVGVHY